MTNQEKQDKSESEQHFWANLWRESLVAMSLGWDLAIPIFAGVLAGYFLDRFFGTRYIFTVGLLMMGVMIGYYNLGSFIHRLNQSDKRRKAAREQEVQKKDEADE